MVGNLAKGRASKACSQSRHRYWAGSDTQAEHCTYTSLAASHNVPYKEFSEFLDGALTTSMRPSVRGEQQK